MIVSVNGVLQVPGIDYGASKNSISFMSPPPRGSTIDIRSTRALLARIYGDGSTFLFQFLEDLDQDTTYLLEDAFKLRHVPAVAEALERLEVIVALAKEHG
jgi:hypothetical protein